MHKKPFFLTYINPLCAITVNSSAFLYHIIKLICTFVARMKILIVNTSERTGGAAIAAGRLSEALIDNGVKAKMLVLHKESDALYVGTAGTSLRNKWNFLWERAIIWLNNKFNRDNLFKISIANTGIDITKTQEFREADIIHLHWINQGFLSLHTIHKILNSGKPVVWTMHDMWPATGICHHAYNCDNYQSECHDCPFLQKAGPNDLSTRTFKNKQRMLEGAKNLNFVAVGEWLANRARNSALIGHFPIRVIPNALSLTRFVLTDRNDARTALDIHESYVIVFGAARIDEPIKGFDLLLSALNILKNQKNIDCNDIRLILFGSIKNPELLQQIPIKYTHEGYIDDEDRLSLIYSAANATVSASHYETFGQTLIEAQACGSLPVAFRGSGPDDIINHKENGYLADNLSAESLADGIRWALNANISPRDLRRSVTRRYSESTVAYRYIELYNSISNHG